jgi:hypothetical protein
VGRWNRVLGFAVALSACAVAAAGAATVSPRGTSDNWAGYAAFGPAFKSVRGTWVQPTAQCFSRATSYTGASFWVGLGGNQDDSYKIEQIGTEADCNSDGSPDYYAWYELWPSDSHVLGRIEVLPGDRISARVEIGDSSVRLTLDDVTAGQHFSRTFPMRRPDGSSAEWIAEAPADAVRHGDRITALTDFGTIRFSSASATTSTGRWGAISSPAWHQQAIDFLSDRGNPHDPITSFVDGAAAAHGFPSALASHGTAFTITWAGGVHPAGRGALPAGAA